MRHNGVHFFDISTSRSGPRMVCFVHFDFEMCFAPQGRTLFRHLNFQKMVRTWCALYILTSKCASRHNSVQLLISHLASWLCTRRFSEPTFRPSGATKSLENHSVSRLSYLFAHLHLLSSDSFSSLIFSLLLFSSL